MKKALFAASILLIGLQMEIPAADGYSVTTCWRYGCYNWQSIVPEGTVSADFCSQNFEVGALVRIDIKNNQVMKYDTIVKMSNTLCSYPALSIDGTRVAFFRWPYRVNGNNLEKTGDVLYVSVVDINGKNMKDLVALPCQLGYDNALDFPSDGWVYYVRPRTDLANDALGRAGNEVWKVNVFSSNPASTNVKVLNVETCNYIRRFSINQAATRCAIQTYSYAGLTCGLNNGSGPVPDGGQFRAFYGNSGSCNAKISASGEIAGGYAGGWHDVVQLGGWNGSRMDESRYPMTPYCQEHTSIYTAFTWAGFSMAPNAGCEQLCFSANSDKWYCQNVMWRYAQQKCGTNQLILNWVDKQAIFGTKTLENPPGPSGWMESGIAYHNFAGDFWVRPPSGSDYAYEDIAGQWHQMNKPAGWTRGDTAGIGGSTPVLPVPRAADGARLTAKTDAAGRLRIDFPDRGCYSLIIIDLHGRTVLAQSAYAGLVLRRGAIKAGTYLVRASRSGSVYVQALTIAN